MGGLPTNVTSIMPPVALTASSGARRLGVVVLLAVALLGSASAVRAGEPRPVAVEGGGSYVEAAPATVAGLIASKRVTLVNVHIPYAGEIEGTSLFVPYDQVASRLDRFPADRHARVVIYCRSGHMGAIAARTLVRLGYTDVWNLAGGMVAWEEAGYSLVRRR